MHFWKIYSEYPKSRESKTYGFRKELLKVIGEKEETIGSARRPLRLDQRPIQRQQQISPVDACAENMV
jgi:hypothetical protein